MPTSGEPERAAPQRVDEPAPASEIEAHQLFLFTVPAELPAERVTEAKIRDLLAHAGPERMALMWRVLRELGDG